MLREFAQTAKLKLSTLPLSFSLQKLTTYSLRKKSFWGLNRAHEKVFGSKLRYSLLRFPHNRNRKCPVLALARRRIQIRELGIFVLSGVRISKVFVVPISTVEILPTSGSAVSWRHIGYVCLATTRLQSVLKLSLRGLVLVMTVSYFPNCFNKHNRCTI